jgi:SAM-dependent methyltransferase
MAGDTPDRWERVYRSRDTDEPSWYEPSPRVSLELIEEAGLPPTAGIIDAGGGTAGLAGELLRRGYTDVTVADMSAEALERAKRALGSRADGVSWVEADIRDHDFGRCFDLWHDRALLHFMVEQADRDAYLATLRRTLAAAGHLVIATFGPEGPTECSGLPVYRYDAARLAETLGAGYRLVSSVLHDHQTPAGRTQQFLYAHLTSLGVGE